MKRSDKQTEYILLQACTTSNWDGGDFSIVHVTDAWKNKFVKRLKLTRMFKKERDFSHVPWSDIIEGFYTYSAETVDVILTGVDAWSFIEITQDELQSLEEVQTELCGCEFVLDTGGYGLFRAFAEQNDDSFYAHDFKIEEVLNKI